MINTNEPNSELLKIFTQEQRIDLTYPDFRREFDGPVIRLISQGMEDGFIIYSRLDAENVDRAIDAQIARFEEVPQAFEWKVYDYDTPSDLIERLRQKGFEIGAPETLMVLDLNTGPEALRRKVSPSVVRILDPGDVDAITSLETSVWDEDQRDLGERLKHDLQEYPEILSIYISYQDKQPASAAWTYFHAGSSFASLWGGATLPEYRQQGHYTDLLAARAQEAWARGFKLLTVDASPMSQPILQKHGFQKLAVTTPCTWNLRRD